jgi:hypothetical protein
MTILIRRQGRLGIAKARAAVAGSPSSIQARTRQLLHPFQGLDSQHGEPVGEHPLGGQAHR